MTLLVFVAGVTAICLDRHNFATDSSPWALRRRPRRQRATAEEATGLHLGETPLLRTAGLTKRYGLSCQRSDRHRVALRLCMRSDRRVFCELASLPDIERVGGEVRKIGVPVLRDLKACRHPDLFMTHDVIEKPHQR